MIGLSEVEQIHNILIDKFGGAKGIRDKGGLEAALARPYQTFDGTELYVDAIQKAAAIFESIISNHPFVDGNKRTAYVLMRLILLEHGLNIRAGQEQKYEFVINAAKGELTFDQISEWIKTHLK